MTLTGSLSGRSSRALLAAFVLGAFALGTSENVVAGILTPLADSLNVTAARAGLLVSAYAGTAVLAGPLLALATGRVSLRLVTLVALTTYVIGTALAALAPNYSILMAARVVTGGAHTTVLVAFILTAMEMAAPDRKGQAVGRITLGLGIASVAGVPIGNLVAEGLGWRWAFVLIAVLVTVTLVVLGVYYPHQSAPRTPAGWRSLHVLARRPVALGISLSALTALGAMVMLSYALPLLERAGVAQTWISPVLALYGVVCLVGNSVGTRLADRSLYRAIVLTIAGVTAALLACGFLAVNPAGAAFALSLVGLSYFSTFPPLNTWVAIHAAELAPDLALAVNSSAFNLGIAGAGWAGSVALAAGVSPPNLALLGLPAVVTALVAVLLLRGKR